MNLSAPFVARPVATLLLALGVLLLGIVSYSQLPIAALPNVDRPTIWVFAGIPGASADTIASAVAQPLERQLGTTPGIAEMASFSAMGGATVYIQFDLSKDIDAAAAAVQAAINAATPNLPKDLPQPPIYGKANPSGYPVIVLAMTSDTLDPSDVYDIADSVVGEQLSQLPGVARVLISGAERSAVRVQASPRLMANMGISLEQVRTTVQSSSMNLPKGMIQDGTMSWTLAANDQLLKAADYADLVVAWRNGAAVHLRDVASVTDSVVNNKLAGWFGDRRGVVISVYKQLDANVVATVDAVNAALPALARWVPPSVRTHVVFDRTTLIRAAIADVQFTIAIAVALVVLVVGLFLRRMTATVIPALTVPVALAATAVAMTLCGYSLDNLSLMAATISIGFIVDDAVIVVENVIRRIDDGADPRAAALGSARQMSFTIVAITAALVAALIPVLFMPDVVGRYFREFGITLAAAIGFSALVSLTLTPMLCSRMLKPAAETMRTESRLMRFYMRSLDWALRHALVVVTILFIVTAASAGLYAVLPKGFMPTQDTGILMVRTNTVANVSFTAMESLQREVARVIQADPAVAALTSFVGAGTGGSLNNGTIYAGLKPLDERREPIREVIERLREKLSRVNGIRTFFIPLQDLNLGAQSSSSRYQYTMSGASPAELFQWEEQMRRRMLTMPEITDVITNLEAVGLQAGLTIDRTRAAAMGVTPLAIDATLNDAFAQRWVRLIYHPMNYTRVVMEVDPAAGDDPEVFQNIYVPGVKSSQVPLSSLMRPFRAHAPMWVNHSDQFPSATISFDTRAGVSLGAAMAAIGAAEREIRLPGEIKAGFKGEAGEAAKSGVKQIVLFAGAIVAVYLVLGMLYESFAHPFTILSTLPPALFGALLALWAMHIEFTLISSIACVLLVGMVMKNAIMMVDFALEIERGRGLAPRDAIREAARQRVRPIVMTTLVGILGAVPLALGSGPGHELRQPLGVASIGGLMASQLLTLYSTPVIYLLVGAGVARRRRTGKVALAS